MLVLLRVASIFFYILHAAFFLYYFSKFFPIKNQYGKLFAAALAVSIVPAVIMAFTDIPYWGAFFLLFFIVAGLKLLYRMDVLLAFYEGFNYTLLFYIIKGTIVSAASFSTGISINSLLKAPLLYQTVYITAVVICAKALILIQKRVSYDKMKLLLGNKRQVKFLMIIQLAVFAYNMLIDAGRFLDIPLLWLSILYFLSNALSMGILSYVHCDSVKISGLLKSEEHVKTLQEQLDKQVKHYASHSKYLENLRAFKHDYNNIIASVKGLLLNQEYELAVKTIDEMQDTLRRNDLARKKYANHVLIDAILQNTANTCELNGILFEAKVILPENLAVSNLDLVRIFSNLLDNAVEACQKIPASSERFIKVKNNTGMENDWISVQIANTFNGEALIKDDRLKSTKLNEDIHGIGLKIVTDILDSLGGFLQIDTDKIKNIFIVNLQIPN